MNKLFAVLPLLTVLTLLSPECRAADEPDLKEAVKTMSVMKKGEELNQGLLAIAYDQDVIGSSPLK